jgi:hypothetical protein
MSSTHKLDQVYGHREISSFDGEASTSKISKRSWCLTVGEMSFEIQKISRVVISGYIRQFLYRKLVV